MGLEDDIAHRRRHLDEEQSQQRSDAEWRAQQLHALTEQAHTDLRKAAQKLTENHVATIDFWSSADSRWKGSSRRRNLRQVFEPAGRRIGHGWIVADCRHQGGNGWALTTNGSS